MILKTIKTTLITKLISIEGFIQVMRGNIMTLLEEDSSSTASSSKSEISLELSFPTITLSKTSDLNTFQQRR